MSHAGIGAAWQLNNVIPAVRFRRVVQAGAGNWMSRTGIARLGDLGSACASASGGPSVTGVPSDTLTLRLVVAGGDAANARRPARSP
jgi:hypothetical protein